MVTTDCLAFNAAHTQKASLKHKSIGLWTSLVVPGQAVPCPCPSKSQKCSSTTKIAPSPPPPKEPSEGKISAKCCLFMTCLRKQLLAFGLGSVCKADPSQFYAFCCSHNIKHFNKYTILRAIKLINHASLIPMFQTISVYSWLACTWGLGSLLCLQCRRGTEQKT